MKQPLQIALTAEADLSLDEQQALLSGALREQFGMDMDGCCRFYLYETFSDYLIARGPNSCLYRISYTISGDQVTFGDAEEVTTAYVPVTESCEFLSSEGDAQPASGKYQIVALKAGWGTGAVNGSSVAHYYPPAFVALVAEAVNGKPFGRRHPDQRGPDPTGAADPDRIAGWLEGGAFDANRALTTINLFSAESVLRSRLDEAREKKTIGNFAVSMLASVGYKPGVMEGKQCLVAESLGTLYSVDLCQRGGAGGQFLTAASFAASDVSAAQLRAVNPQSTAIVPDRTNRGGAAGASEGAHMKKSLLQLLAALNARNATRGAELSLKFANTAEADYPALLDLVTTAFAEVPATPAPAPVLVTAEAALATLAEAQRIQSRNRITTSLVDSKLPVPAQDMARRHLEAVLTSEADVPQATIDAEITSVRTAFAAFSNVGRVVPGQVLLDSSDKMALAMESAFGVKASIGKGVSPFRGLRDAYTTITGDYNLDKLSRGGGFTSNLQLTSEAVVTGDFPNILLNSMTKRLLQDYAELSIDGLSMLYTAVPVSDYKLQDRVREGYFGELSTVTESNTYTEIGYPTDERVNYQVSKKGNLLTISEETIRNDDLGAIARFPGRLARAGRFTLKRSITNLYINNPNYLADSVAWFNSAHSNLIALALSNDALIIARTSLRLQQEKDSDEPLGLPLQWIMVPAALESTAIAINQTNTAGSNQFFQAFGANNERIIVNELLDASDVNDWYYGTSMTNVPCVEVGFLDGIEQPQIFLANQPTVGTQFTADELQYKVKFVYGLVITDFRGVGKSVVA